MCKNFTVLTATGSVDAVIEVYIQPKVLDFINTSVVASQYSPKRPDDIGANIYHEPFEASL